MTKSKFIQLLIEKVVIASLVAAFSTALLFGYNLYNKSFDSAREQSRAFSSFAIAQKDAVLNASKEIRTALYDLRYRSTGYDTKDAKSKDVKAKDNKDGATGTPSSVEDGVARDRPSAAKVRYEMVRHLVELDSSINWLAGSNPVRSVHSEGDLPTESFKKSASLAREISQALGPLAVGSQSAEAPSLREDLAKVNQLEAQFVQTFNAELGTALSTEFTQFFESYYRGVPWYGQPIFLILLAIGALILSVVTFFLLPADPRPTTFID